MVDLIDSSLYPTPVQLWRDLGEHFYPREEWPNYLLCMWFECELHYKNRMVLFNFAYLNGMSPAVFSKLILLNPTCTFKRLVKMMYLYKYFNGSYEFDHIRDSGEILQRRTKYHSFCIFHQRVEDLNHFPRRIHPKVQGYRSQEDERTRYDLCAEYLRRLG